MDAPAALVLPAGVNEIDAVIYLASLASNSRAIDPMLDRMRAITASRSAQAPLSSSETATLRQVYSDIGTYLVENEPVRAFTTEDLQIRVQNHFLSDKANRHLSIQLSVVILGTLLLGLLSLLVPVPSTEHDKIEFHALLAIPLMFSALHLGAAWLFGSALEFFRHRFRQAYGVLVAGIVLFGLAHLQLAVYGVFDYWDSGWVHDGGAALLYVPGLALIYASVMAFARTIDTKPQRIWTILALSTALAAGLIATLASHTPARLNEHFFDFSMGLTSIVTVLNAFASFKAFQLSRLINEIYRKPLRLLGLSLALTLAAAGQFVIIRLTTGYAIDYVRTGLIMLPFLISGIMLVRTSYVFNRSSSY